LIDLVSDKEVKVAVKVIKKKKAIGPDGMLVEAWKMLDVSIGWLKDLFNQVLIKKEERWLNTIENDMRPM
jgi:hypothetical protein